jgi:hypothetical protein
MQQFGLGCGSNHQRARKAGREDAKPPILPVFFFVGEEASTSLTESVMANKRFILPIAHPTSTGRPQPTPNPYGADLAPPHSTMDRAINPRNRITAV